MTSINQLRFGLTCRYVKPEMIDAQLHSKGDLDIDPTKAYDGDLKAFDEWIQQADALKFAGSQRRRGASPFARAA